MKRRLKNINEIDVFLCFLGLAEGLLNIAIIRRILTTQMAEIIKMKEKRCYSVSDLQEMLEISKPAVYELLKRREFHWVMIGGRYKISKRSFDEWLDGSFERNQSSSEAMESI